MVKLASDNKAHIPMIETACRKQSEIDSIYQHLDDGNARMTAIEVSMAEYHKTAAEDRQRLEAKQDVNNADTAELLEIIRMGKGLFRGAAWIGKWARKSVMWLGPPISILVGIWYTIKQWK